MITAIIVDDEQGGIENLRELIRKYCPQVKVAGEGRSADDAERLIAELRPQLVFLDIEMPFRNGLDLLMRFEKLSFEVIFVTAFEKYVLKAIKLSACDYIMKPVDVSELIAAVNKASERIAIAAESVHLRTFLANVKEADQRERKIALPSMHGFTFVKIRDIIHCVADGSCTWFHISGKEKILVSKNLGEYESLLGDRDFIRVHHTHLINRHHIAEFKKGNAPTLIMSDGNSVPVSQRKRDMLMEQLYSI